MMCKSKGEILLITETPKNGNSTAPFQAFLSLPLLKKRS